MKYSTYTNLVVVSGLVAAGIATFFFVMFPVLYIVLVAFAAFGVFMTTLMFYFIVEELREKKAKELHARRRAAETNPCNKP